VRVVLLVELPDGVFVAGDALGTSWPIEGAPAACEMTLPRQPLPDDDPTAWARTLQSPPVTGAERALSAFEEHANDDDLVPFWGKQSEGDGRGGVAAAWVRHVVVHTSYDGAADDESKMQFADVTGKVIDVWIDNVTEWLEILARIDVRPGKPAGARRLEPKYVHPLPIELNEQHGAPTWFTTMSQLSGLTHETERAARDQWAWAVAHANAGDVIPDEYLFLRDARAALRRGDCRKAAIDAGTAAEVALSNAIRQRLTDAGRDPEAIRQILKDTSGVVELYDLYSVLDACLPISRKRLMDRVAHKRNDAAHAGQPPTPGETKRGIETVLELLDAIAPLT
jgi:hypothetical protein